jgi:bacterial/archaeal transporter family-2 protein
VGSWPYFAFALAAGSMLPLQAGVNAILARWVGGAVPAALVSFAVGTAALLAVALVFARPGVERAGDAPAWVWIGGFLGAFYVAGAIVTAPRLGAVLFLAVLLAGQFLSSLVVDHFGWIGFEEHPITPGRLVGVALLAAGVLLIRVT